MIAARSRPAPRLPACRLHGPLTAAWLNRGLDRSTRATVNSLAGQAEAFGQIAGGRSVVAPLIAGASLRLPAAALFARGASVPGADQLAPVLPEVDHRP